MSVRAARWQRESACPSQPKTNTRADKRLSRVFVDLGGKTHVASVGRKKYPMIVKADLSRHACGYI